MKLFEYNRYGNDIVAHNKSLFTEFPVSLFDPKYLTANSLLQSNNVNTHDVKGRGKVFFFKYNEQNLVLRHYRRGGQIAKFNKDTYVWKGLKKTRAIDELQLLSTLQEMNLPVPTPIAACIRRSGLLYKADVVTELIPNTQSLRSKLAKDTVSLETWQEIGSIIRQFHDSNCNHADLNAHNILIDTINKIYLIDFDKSKIDTSGNAWRQNNLARLQRSFEKLKNSEPKFNYVVQDFQTLLAGYNRS